MVLAGFLLMGLIFMAPQGADAATIDSDVEILRVNQGESFATIYVRNVKTGIMWELRLFENHPNKNAMLAVLLTAVSLDEIVRIRWEEGTPPKLLRVAINKLPLP